MALISCPECKKEVSTSAGTCPSCGHPLQNKAMTKPAGCFLQLLSIPFIIGGIGVASGSSLGGGFVLLLIGLGLLYAGGRPARNG